MKNNRKKICLAEKR